MLGLLNVLAVLCALLSGNAMLRLVACALLPERAR